MSPNMALLGRSFVKVLTQIFSLDVWGQLKLTGGIASCLHGFMDLQLEAIWRFLSFLCSSFHQPWQVVIVGSFAYVLGRSQSEKLQKLQAQVRFFFYVLWMFTILPLLLSIGLFTIASTLYSWRMPFVTWLKWVGEFSIIFPILGRFRSHKSHNPIVGRYLWVRLRSSNSSIVPWWSWHEWK